jgi:chemotaxis protein MotB
MSEEVESEEPGGLPAWVMTFADLMTLLMCFYVLMLSFSEMDVAKFKELAGSVQNAFGVQTDVNVKNIPKGTSIIAREFSPGKPEPTPVNTVRQFTINSNENSLDVEQNKAKLKQLEEMEERARLAEEAAQRLREVLLNEISGGKLLIRREGNTVVLHILERHSFKSGQADLEAGFRPSIQRIASVLGAMKGAITIAGHTDDVPISNSQFRSNWDLSAARAASVATEILKTGSIEPTRLKIAGFAETQPRVPNDSSNNRAKNRRIDITFTTGKERHASWSEENEQPFESTQPAVGPADEPAVLPDRNS